VPGLTFGSFSYERIGFASFASKRSLKFIFTDKCKQFYTLSNKRSIAESSRPTGGQLRIELDPAADYPVPVEIFFDKAKTLLAETPG